MAVVGGTIQKIIESNKVITDAVLCVQEVTEIQNNPKIGLKLKLTDGEGILTGIMSRSIGASLKQAQLSHGSLIQLVGYTKSEKHSSSVIIINSLPKILSSPTLNPENDNDISYEVQQNEDSAARILPASLSRSSYVPIKLLGPTSFNWQIKAKVTKKYERKEWENERGKGLLMNVDLIDEYGSQIQGTFFKEAVDKFDKLIQQNKVYVFTNGTVKKSNQKFTNFKHQWQLAFDKQACVYEVTNDFSLRASEMEDNFKNISDIIQFQNHQKCDYIGVLHKIGKVSQVQLKSGVVKSRMNIEVADDSNLVIIFCLWGRDDLHLEVNQRDPVVIMVKNAKYSDFGKHSLNSNDESEIEINPNIPRTRDLKTWYRNLHSKQKLRCVTELNGALQTAFGLQQDNMILPFSTPNSSLPDREISNKAYIKPSKFRTIAEALTFFNVYAPQAQYLKGYQIQSKDMKFHINGYLSKI